VTGSQVKPISHLAKDYSWAKSISLSDPLPFVFAAGGNRRKETNQQQQTIPH